MVRTYPAAALAALAQLAATAFWRPLGGGTLCHIWWGLCAYYGVLLLAFGARWWWLGARERKR